MTSLSSLKIKPLPPYLIDQIKAGEVIERPASLIKEVVENAIDAGADKIQMEIHGGGMDLISIEDNGEGMTRPELHHAFERHSTSKLNKYEDLFKLDSFGFRGEALASIASISRIHCISESSRGGGKIIIEGGREISLIPMKKNNRGTSLYVKNLFFNTPARLKFIKSKTREKTAIKKILHAFFLSYPEISFTLKWDHLEKEVWPSGEFERRVHRVLLGRGNDSSLMKINEQFEDYKIKGYISESTGNKNQFLSVNGRYFTDRSLHGAIVRTMEPLWGQGCAGAYFISLSVPSSELDVNVHPGKMEVRFEKISLVFSLISASLKKLLEKNRPVHSPLHPQKNLPSKSEETDTGPLFFPLSSKYILCKWEEDILAVNWPELQIFHLFHHILSPSFVEETKTMPLLINEPFSLEADEWSVRFPWLKKRGLDFEVADKDMILLLSIPFSLNQFPLQETVRSLLTFFSHKNFDLDECRRHFMASFTPLLFTPGRHLLHTILDQTPTNIPEGIISSLNEEKLDTLFS